MDKNSEPNNNNNNNNNNNTNKKYGGLGAYLGPCHGGYFEIRGVKDGSSCEKSGIHDGDQIIEIDGKPVKGLNSSEVSMLIRGLVGSKLKLKISTADGTHKEVVVERVDVNSALGMHYFVSDYQILNQVAKSLDEAREASRQCETAMNGGDFLGARALYLLALSSPIETHGPFDQTKGTLLSSAARFFMSCWAFEQADELYAEIKKIGKADPTFGNEDPRNITVVAETFERAGRLDDAEGVFKNLLELHAKSPDNTWKQQEVIKRYCRFLIGQNRKSEVPKLLKQLEILYGENSAWQNNEFIADAEYAIGSFSESAERYAKAAAQYEEKNPQSQRQFERDRPLVKLLFKSSDAYYACKDFANAARFNSQAIAKHKAATPADMESECERQREFHPSMSQLLIQKGDIQKALGNGDNSNESYEKAMESAKLAFNSDSPWCKVIASRLSAEKELAPSRLIVVEIGDNSVPTHETQSLDVYNAIKSKAHDRLELANRVLTEMQAQSKGNLTVYQIAQIFSLVELEKNNSVKNALDLLVKLNDEIREDQKLSKLVLSVYEDWLHGKEHNSATEFSKTCSILEELTPDEDENHTAAKLPLYEKLRWLALEWRFAHYPEISEALLTKATQLRNKEEAPQNDKHGLARSRSDFDLRMKEDLCLTLIDLQRYSEAEKLALDPVLLNSVSRADGTKWDQICSAFAKANQTKVAERILLAMANQQKPGQPSSYQSAQVLLRLSELYLERGEFTKAEEFAAKSANSQQGHYSTKAYGILAESLDKQNKLKEAVPAYISAAAEEWNSSESKQSREKKLVYLKRALEIQEKLFGKNDSSIIKTLTLLTTALQRAGKNAELKSISERISQVQNRSFQTPEEELKFWQQMSSNYQTSKEPDKAIDAQRQVAKLAEKCNAHWGAEYDHLARLELAQKHFKEAVVAAKKYISSPYFLRYIREMGTTTGIGSPHDPFTDGLIKADHAAAAAEVLRYAENILHSQYGKYDKAAITVSASIAKTQAMTNDYSGCEETCRLALDSLQISRLNEPIIDRFGSGKPIESFLGVATALSERGRDEQAYLLLKRILEIQSMFLGKRNPQIASTESYIANMLVKQNKFLEAKAHAWNAIQIYESNHGMDWHGLHHYVATYLNILRKLELTDEISTVKMKYKEDIDPFGIAFNIRRSSDLTFFRFEASDLEKGRTQLLNMAREEEKLSGPYSSGTRAVIAKLIELETYGQNYELVLELQERLLKITALIDSPEGVEARKQMVEIAELNRKLGRKDESLQMTRNIASILESIPDDAKSSADKFSLINTYIILGEKSRALALLAKLNGQHKTDADEAGFFRQCAGLYTKLGESKESEKLTEMANNIWKKQQEAAEERRQKRTKDQ
ncbi:MAG: PDZ domain-containing protein [Candidatus Obscuribacterales bacterium]|nr:PDZ domain-containing protein [Candidatus Obscuribacterales bacterium]